MSAATPAQIAAAVTDAINAAPGGTFSEPVTAASAFLVVHKLDALETLRVSVVPRSIEIEPQTRGSDRRQARVDVAVQQRCAPDDAQRISELIALTEQIEAHLNRAAMEGFRWLGASIDPLYDATMLRELRVFTSVIELTYVSL